MEASRGAGNRTTTGIVSTAMRSAPPAVDAARNLHFERHVLPHMDAAWALARWLARSGNDAEHDAEDVLQEAMLRAYRYHTPDGIDNVRAWLLKIVRNTFYTLRKQAATSLLDEFDETVHGVEDEAFTPESRLLLDVDTQQVRHAVEQLPLEFREVLVLREFQECSYKDIVEITGLKMGTVMSRLARARERLARQLCGGAEGGRDHAMR